MRKLTLFIATSLDGYIARTNGEIDWLFTDQDYGYQKFYESVSTLLVGRKTYELSLTFPEYPYAGKEVFVFTRNPRLKPDSRVQLVEKNIIQFTRELKKKRGKGIWLVGGGQIVHELHAEGLIDEYRIFIHPFTIGNGIPLFQKTHLSRELKTKRMKKFSSGLIEIQLTKK
ncbi:MAG: dihydrofolate reductase family protein [archaeon]